MLYDMFLIWAAFMLGAISPGPDMVLLIRNSLIHGRIKALMTALGFASGVLIHTLYTLFGLGYILMNSTVLLHGLRYAGALYLGFLGVRALLDKRVPHLDVETNQASAPQHNKSLLAYWAMGCANNLLNPFAALYVISILTAGPMASAPIALRCTLALLLFITYFLWNSFIALALTSPKARKKFLHYVPWVNKGAGMILIALAIKFLMTHPVNPGVCA